MIRTGLKRHFASAALAGVLIASGCSTQTDLGGKAAAVVGDRPTSGLSAEPTPESEPGESTTASEAPVESVETSRLLPEAERGAIDLGETLGVPVIADRYPLYYGSEATPRQSDLASVDYMSAPTVTTVASVDSLARGVTPDGSRAWVALPDPAGDLSCPEGQVGTVLGSVAIDGSDEPRLVTGWEALPQNVTEVHYGPRNMAVLYATCGKYTTAVAFAKVSAAGEFSEVRLLDPAMDLSIGVFAPRWLWAVNDQATFHDDPGELVLVVPQLGISAPGDPFLGPADVYITVDDNRIVDIWPTDDEIGEDEHLRRQIGWSERPPLIEVSSGFGPDGPLRSQWYAVGGPEGAALASFGITGPLALTDRPIRDLDWSPAGGWLAITGPDGTTLHREGTTVDLDSEPGRFARFTPDGASLVVVGNTTVDTYTFGAVDPLADEDVLTSFSAIDSGGLGPIRIEMLVSELRSLLVTDLRIDGIDGVEPGYCVWVVAPSMPNVWMLGEATEDGDDAVITRVTIDAGPWATPSGLRLGSTEREVLDALGDNVTARPHTYTAGKYLDFAPTDRADPNGVRFETNGHEVNSISVGRLGWVELVEGCA